MIYVFDLDGTLCSTPDGGVYSNCEPRWSRIELVRELYADGHTIVISTARGPMWYDFTKEQLRGWDVPFHVVSVGAKPYGDLYVDDKAVNALDFFMDDGL